MSRFYDDPDNATDHGVEVFCATLENLRDITDKHGLRAGVASAMGLLYGLSQFLHETRGIDMLRKSFADVEASALKGERGSAFAYADTTASLN
jgi:hypothetical protein